MQLPFSVTVVPPARSDLKRLARSRSAWMVALAILLGIIATIFVFVVLAMAPTSNRSAPAGGIRLVGVPTDVSASIDGQEIAHTSPTMAVPIGEHVVAFHGQRILDASYRVTVHANEQTALTPDLRLRAPLIWRLRPTYPGSTIVAASFLSDGRVALIEALPPGDDDQLWLVDSSGEPRRVGPPDQTHVSAVSPDGDRVAYLVQGIMPSKRSNGPNQVWIAGSDDESAHRFLALTPGTAPEDFTDVSWAPDGQHLLVVSRLTDRSGGSWSRLRWLNLAFGRVRELATFPGDVVFQSYSWSPVSTRVAFLTRLGSSVALCILDVTSASFQDVAEVARGGDTPFPFAPVAWSPDGRLLYTATVASTSSPGWLFGSKSRVDLFAVDLPRPVSQNLGSNLGQYPALLPDGGILLVDHARADAPYVVRRVDPPGQPRDLFSISAERSSTFAVRWDLAHDQALLLTRAVGTTSTAPIDVWLVRFGAEASR